MVLPRADPRTGVCPPSPFKQLPVPPHPMNFPAVSPLSHILGQLTFTDHQILKDGSVLMCGVQGIKLMRQDGLRAEADPKVKVKRRILDFAAGQGTPLCCRAVGEKQEVVVDGTENGWVDWWSLAKDRFNPADKKEVKAVKASNKSIRRIRAAGLNTDMILAASDDGNIYLLDNTIPDPITAYIGAVVPGICAFDSSPVDHGLFAAATPQDTIIIADCKAGLTMLEISRVKQVTDIAFSPKGDSLFVGTKAGLVLQIDLQLANIKSRLPKKEPSPVCTPPTTIALERALARSHKLTQEVTAIHTRLEKTEALLGNILQKCTPEGN